MCFCASPSHGFPSKLSKPASSKSMHTAFLITKTFAAVDGGGLNNSTCAGRFGGGGDGG